MSSIRCVMSGCWSGRGTIVNIVQLTIAEIRTLIAEALTEMIPARVEVDRMIDNARDDKGAAAKVLSFLDRHFPQRSKPFIQQLGRTLMLWQAGRSSFGDVQAIVDKLYASVTVQKRPSSYSGLTAVRASQPPRSAAS